MQSETTEPDPQAGSCIACVRPRSIIARSVKLAETLLDSALAATVHHGFGSFFPEPPELQILCKNWAQIKPELADIDLDVYKGYSQIQSFAPKSRLNVRRTSLLHPVDFVFYTALVLALKPHISAARLGADRVFSHRAESVGPNILYGSTPSWKDFRTAIRTRIENNPPAFVAITDIADFYPRIYQHRLVNAVEVATGPSERDYVRVLEKMLFRFADGTSYGIPVGPPASRLLGEAVLIDVDSALLSYGIDFVRFVDDFVMFADDSQHAEYALRILGETLFLHHGLTLQTAKTKVLTAGEYQDQYLTLHSDKEETRRKLLNIFGDADYEVISYEDLEEEQQRELDAFNLSGMLTDALAEGENVNYREVSFILGRLSALQKPELIPIVIQSLEKLYPAAESAAAFFKSFSELAFTTRQEIATALLRPILDAHSARPSEYYCIWVLSIFQNDKAWNHAGDLLRIFREASSDAIKRYAALGLAVAGSRPEALVMKEYLSGGSALSRTAMLLATAKLGSDERKYFRKSLGLSDMFERLCAEAQV